MHVKPISFKNHHHRHSNVLYILIHSGTSRRPALSNGIFTIKSPFPSWLWSSSNCYPATGSARHTISGCDKIALKWPACGEPAKVLRPKTNHHLGASACEDNCSQLLKVRMYHRVSAARSIVRSRAVDYPFGPELNSCSWLWGCRTVSSRNRHLTLSLAARLFIIHVVNHVHWWSISTRLVRD